jgi:hypothetical protein
VPPAVANIGKENNVGSCFLLIVDSEATVDSHHCSLSFWDSHLREALEFNLYILDAVLCT